MCYDSHQIANYFIKKSHSTGVELTPMKLIKLAYIAHGWRLGLYDKELLDEVIYAWKFGPVIDTLYSDFKSYGKGQITELYKDYNTGSYPFPDSEIHPFLDEIWKVYGNFNGLQLSSKTHKEGTPWDIVWNKEGGKKHSFAIIPNDLIKKHYKDKIASMNGEPTTTLAPSL